MTEAVLNQFIPTLTTERLILRPHNMDDLDYFIDFWANSEIVTYIGGGVTRTPADVWMRFQRNIGSWGLLNYGFWCIYHKEDNVQIGEAGFMDAKRGLSGIGQDPESGWVLHPDYWGKGYGHETIAAFLNWGDQQAGFEKTACLIDHDNVASKKLAEKNDYILQQTILFGGTDCMIYQRDRQNHHVT